MLKLDFYYVGSKQKFINKSKVYHQR